MYYKLVYKDCISGILYSICRNTNILPFEYRVTYIPGEWISPKIQNSGLFVFSSLEDVRQFIWDEGYHKREVEIWECKVKHEIKIPRRIATIQTFEYWHQLNTIKRKKQRVDEMKVTYGGKVAPSGTKCFKQIKLHKKIEHD